MTVQSGSASSHQQEPNFEFMQVLYHGKWVNMHNLMDLEALIETVEATLENTIDIDISVSLISELMVLVGNNLLILVML